MSADLSAAINAARLSLAGHLTPDYSGLIARKAVTAAAPLIEAAVR